ncbi:MAG TPA: alpha-hydroxy acid oxidase [Egibacteraceae bacterium]|nr:alpha-hydroxy acid oxidase [Egibacteraceae bacterium]HVM14613.1 alpha-hydroxy acid oxidase [Egibacteraceae bacterium]HVM18639.1 alpha-hydroxy acid oxidase [Egibacteraceae bacterium]
MAELEQKARAALDPAVYDYFAGGADDEVTLAENVAAWQRLRLRPHVLNDVGEVDPRATVLGQSLTAPIIVAPAAYQRLAHPDGEMATARGAGAVGTVMCVSTMATTTLEEVAAAATGDLWFQLYIRRDRRYTEELVARAETAGYRALVLTVDVPVLGRRLRDERNHFTLPPGLTMANFGTAPPTVEGSGIAAFADSEFDPSLTPDDLAWLCGLTRLPVLVKGVMRGDDAVRAVDAGAAGVIVSNHGGRQLDTCIAPAEAVREVAAAVGDRAEVLVDGGVRRGTDVVKALALGASAVLVARPVLWGLAAAGAQGVTAVLNELIEEFTRALMLCGCRTPDDITPDLIANPPPV